MKRIADRADPRLKAGDASYRAFFDHAIEGIFRTTPEGRYIDANPALARIYGYSSPSHLILGLTDIGDQLYVDPRRRQEFQRLMQANDQVSRFESEIRRRDGSTIWIAENARAVRDWSGRIVCYEGMVEDVTARYAAQMAMRKALKEAEEANRAKSAFLAAMSHELKTPLNAVLGFSEIMAGEMLGPISPPSYRGYAVDIHASGTRLLSIISDILDVARLSGGAITLNAQPLAPADLAESALALARQATRDEREVLVDVPLTLPDIDADPQRLRQCLANIISNALKFTDSSGQVSVHAWIERSGGVSFSVRDQGIGMAPEKIAAALEPFRQLDGSLARKFEGTGLGLSIAKSLAELHGGTLTVESSVGLGTTVTVALPPARTCPREALAS
ncbi:MAG: PAS domain S-box protein [Proteobacteria bacterium]|nr:PAS domain S-box protein [Pseudomonadota bacterium]